MGNSKGDQPLSEDESVAIPNIVNIRKGLKPGQVREGALWGGDGRLPQLPHDAQLASAAFGGNLAEIIVRHCLELPGIAQISNRILTSWCRAA